MDLIALSLYVAPIIGLTTILIGLGAMLKPESMSGNFGIPATGKAKAWVVSVGVRDIFMGFTVLVLYFNQSWFELAFINLAIGVVALSDFYVVLKDGDRLKSYTHFAGAVAVLFYGAWIILMVQFVTDSKQFLKISNCVQFWSTIKIMYFVYYNSHRNNHWWEKIKNENDATIEKSAGRWLIGWW